MKTKKSTKIIALILAIAIFTTFAVTASAAGRFSDVPSGIWYEKAVNYCAENGYVSGVGDSKYDPNGKVSRAMIAQVLWNKNGKIEPTIQSPFTDVSNQWFAKAVLWCYENKITSGTSATTFSPNAAITREQFCALVFNSKKLDPSFSFDNDETWLLNFTDKNSVSSWAKNAMIWAYQTGFISGTSSTTLEPKGLANRAQMAQFLYNLDHPKTIQKPDPSEVKPVEPVYGENTRWTKELAPMQTTKCVRVSDGVKFMAPSEKSSEPIEWYVLPHYEIGSGMIPYFNAAEKDIQPIPADGVINEGDPYWTMLGCIPHGGYVENNRIYLPIGVADSDWIGELYDPSSRQSQKKAPAEYTWRVDVTSVDGKMTPDEKQVLDIENQWRAEKGLQPLVWDETLQMSAEAAALIQCADCYASEAGARELGLYLSTHHKIMGTLHALEPSPAITAEAQKGVVTFKRCIAVELITLNAYEHNADSDRPIGENMAWSTNWNVETMMREYKTSSGHYYQVLGQYWRITGTGNVHISGTNIVSANCCQFDR